MALIHFAALLLFAATVRADSQCSTQRSSNIKFLITSGTNATGHKIATINFTSLTEEVGESTLSVEHWTTHCHGMETLTLGVVASSPTNKIEVTDNKDLAETTAPPDKLFTDKYPGYNLVPGLGYYKIDVNKKVTWDEARRHCEGEGAKMLVTESQEEYNPVQDMFKKVNPKIGGWLGVRRTDGQWRTMDGRVVESTSIKWASVYPKQDGDCLFLRTDGIGNWRCDASALFMCERPLW